MSLIFFVWGLWVIASISSSSLRPPAGLEDVLDESCGSDAEDELAPEFDDNPGTTIGTKPLAENPLSFLGQMWLLTVGPLISI